MVFVARYSSVRETATGDQHRGVEAVRCDCLGAASNLDQPGGFRSSRPDASGVGRTLVGVIHLQGTVAWITTQQSMS
jgi:hypothetical protein